MKIYFAHSIKQYDTFFERKCIEMIKQKFPTGKIINPKDYYLGYMEEYLDIVKQCDIVVFTRWNGYITSGVAQEIQTALKLKKPVFEIRKGKLVEIKKMPRTKVLDYEDTILAYH